MSYYAELETDKYIRETFFPDYSYKGIMVDVGAGPSEYISMSKHFRDNGWRCICVEPNPKFIEAHRKDGHEIYEYACSTKDGEDSFTIVDGDEKDPRAGICYSALRVKYKMPSTLPMVEIKVKTRTLNSLLEELNIKKIDFLSVDTEGWEVDVMEGFDVDKYKPKVILLENYYDEVSYVEYMQKRGYRLEHKISYNYIFTRIGQSTMEKEWMDYNKQLLKEVNDSLLPDAGEKTGKVGIFVNGQNGDIMTVMSCLKYRDKLFPKKEIIWYCNLPQANLLKYSPISEVRPYPWPGNGLPLDSQNFYPMLCNDKNRLNEYSKNFELTADLDEGHFPATWQYGVKGNLDYPSISRKHFGFDQSVPWHPLLGFSDEEKNMVREFVDKLPKRKTVMIETFGGSGQSHWDHKNTLATKRICREVWGDCNFIFTCPQYIRSSYEFPQELFDDIGVVSCSHFDIRQTGLLINYCDLFVGVSSAISVATSHWDSKPVPKIQFCGSFKCSTVTLSTGEIVLVDHGDYDQDKNNSHQRKRYENKLTELLHKYK